MDVKTEINKDDLTPEQRKALNKERSKANLKPFKPMSELTPEEQERQRKITYKAGQATKAVYEKRKSMNELAKALLNSKVSRRKAETLLGDDLEIFENADSLTVADILNGAMVNAVVVDRNAKAYEILRDTAGYAPKKDPIEITANIMTDDERILLENVRKRLALVQNDKKMIGENNA